MRHKLLLTGVLLLSLTGCGVLSKPPVVVRQALPPEWALQECPIPELPNLTNKDLVDGQVALLDSLSACNDDKAALRKWREIIKQAEERKHGRTP